MVENLTIQSHKGPYTVHFEEDALETLNADIPENTHFIIDRNIAELYRDKIPNILNHESVLLIEAIEPHKSLEECPKYVEHLVSCGMRRGHTLLAIGGGIIQDITCFLAATMLRGVPWRFFPTTLLAQADSCIGSKSSINAGSAKNILGTFTPPARIDLSTRFLDTLPARDVRSGVGEMIKVHVIDGPESFDTIAADYERIFEDREVMRHYLRRSLAIKQGYIEKDEFDQTIRLVFNYGHSFGHAIEAATNFEIPHGIAVTIGMDMANWVSAQMGVGTEAHFERMHPTMAKNYAGYENTAVPIDVFIKSISKDKKNLGKGKVTLILPDKDGKIFRDSYDNDDTFRDLCERFLTEVRGTSLVTA
jgi:3-dehydroquinate synthase